MSQDEIARQTVLRVTYVDVESERLLDERRLRRGDLPPGLRFAPQLQLAGHTWAVVATEPRDAAGALREGRLRITVRKVSDLTDRGLFFRQPTVAGALPPLDRSRRRAGAVLEVAEDSWLQVELVGLDVLEAVERCLAAVRRAIDRRAPGGFPLLHVRREVSRPLTTAALTLAETCERFPGAFCYDGLAYGGVQALIEGGFAFQIASSIQVYGRVADGAVVCLGLDGRGAGASFGADVTALTELATERRLALVDWCRGTVLTPEAFAGYFRQRA